MYTLQIQTKYVFHSESPNILKVLTPVPTYLTKYESGQWFVIFSFFGTQPFVINNTNNQILRITFNKYFESLRNPHYYE